MVKPAVKAFNKAFKALLKELQRALPDDADLQPLVFGFKMLKVTQPSMPARMFHDLMVVPHAAAIRARDLAYFVDPAFCVPGWEDTCAYLRRVADALSPATLQHAWEHLGQLLLLDEQLRGRDGV